MVKIQVVNFYIDGATADQKASFESCALTNVTLTPGGRADTNSDHVVDIVDLATVASRFNTTVTAGDPADVNGDGVVNMLDLAKMSLSFGRVL